MRQRRIALGFVWIALACATAIMIANSPNVATIGVSVIAWLGGILSYMIVVERRRY